MKEYADIQEKAISVFGDAQIAAEWLKTPVPVLNGQAPNDLLDTPLGRQRVLEVLDAIDTGNFS